MRLVSVVVPDWLTAMASVSLMSSRRPKPDSSVAVIASTSSVGAGQLVEDRCGALAGDGGGALSDHPDPRDRAGGEPIGDVGGQRPLADVGAEQAVAFDDLAAQRLGEAVRRLADLLEQEVWGVAAVDVAGGHLGGGDVGVGDRQLGAVVARAADAGELTGAVRRRARRSRRRARRPSARSAPSPRPRRTARWRR